MQILYTNKVSPKLGGGAETRILEVGRRLVERGHSVMVVCGKTEPSMPDEEQYDGLHLFNITTLPKSMLASLSPRLRFHLSRYLYYPVALRQMRRLLQQRHFDVWRDDIAPFPLVGAQVLAHRHRIPLIGTVHNLSGTWSQWRSFYGIGAGTAGYLGEQWVRRKRPYRVVISDSRWMEETLAKDLGQEGVTWIPNGVDIQKFYPVPRPPSDIVHLLYVGRFVPLKGHKTLLEAFARVVSVNPAVKLHLVGDGPDQKAYEEMIQERGLADYVVLHGKLPKDKMPDIFRAADIYVSPSLFEGLPVTMLEAMASGLPIISTRISAIDGILDEHCALCVEVNSPSLLAESILRLVYDRSLRLEMGQAGFNYVGQRFTWDRVVDAELEVYKRVCTTNQY